MSVPLPCAMSNHRIRTDLSYVKGAHNARFCFQFSQLRDIENFRLDGEMVI